MYIWTLKIRAIEHEKLMVDYLTGRVYYKLLPFNGSVWTA